MHIRPSQPTDLSAMADIMAANNRTDSLSRFITRDIDRYPFTYHRGSLRFLKGLLLTPGTVGFVAVTDADDYAADDSAYDFAASGEEVVAYARWQRHGVSEKARGWQAGWGGGWWDGLTRMSMRFEAKYQQTWPFSLSEQTFDHAHFGSIVHVLGEAWDPDVFAKCWELLALYTHSEWQRRGLGKQLMEWGKERAREEGVPVIVQGSPVGGVVYRAAGFKEVGVLGLGQVGGFDELEFGGEVMRRWCWEPEGKYVKEGTAGRWVESARENRRRKEQENAKGDEGKEDKGAEVKDEKTVGITMGVTQ